MTTLNKNTSVTECLPMQTDCGNQPPADAKLWNRIARRYSAKPVPDQALYEQKLAITREYLHGESTVLELGCGTGSTALSHAPFVGQIKAVDFSSQMITIARERAAAESVSNVQFVCSDLRTHLSGRNEYDAILALNLLHLMKDWKQTINAAFHLLKPGGVLISSTACLNDSFSFMRPVASLGRRLGVLPTLSFFGRSEFEHSITATGFEIVKTLHPSAKAGLFLVARKPILVK